MSYTTCFGVKFSNVDCTFPLRKLIISVNTHIVVNIQRKTKKLTEIFFIFKSYRRLFSEISIIKYVSLSIHKEYDWKFNIFTLVSFCCCFILILNFLSLVSSYYFVVVSVW